MSQQPDDPVDLDCGPGLMACLRRYIIAGILTIIPVWVTWLVFQFLIRLLVRAGAPAIAGLAKAVEPRSAELAAWLQNDLFQSVLALLVAIVGLTLLGWITTMVVGQRVVAAFDSLMTRIPLVQQIYGGAKKLITALQQKPDGVQRVVLIDFPSPEMKTVGLVTRTFADADTGEKLAAVYVPTTPNPTSGYLEIVPLSKVTSTNWTVDEAMEFIVSGGAVSPDTMNYSRSVGAPINDVTPLSAEGQGDADEPTATR